MDCIWLYILIPHIWHGFLGFQDIGRRSLVHWCLAWACPPRVRVIYLWSKRHSQASIVARRSRSWWWCSSNCSCHCDRHGCVALCRCCVGDWKALFLLPASLQKCGDEGSHENGHLTRRVREFKSWNSSKYCYDDSLPWDALKVSCLSYYSREWTTST